MSMISGMDVPALWGCPVSNILAWRCETDCRLMLLQVDERDPMGRWVLDRAEDGSQDEAPGLLDATDVLLFGNSHLGEEISEWPATAQYLVKLLSPAGSIEARSLYLGCGHGGKSKQSTWAPLLSVESGSGRVRMRHATIGFRGAWPDWLSIGAGPNLLDRLKVRARARFLLGLVRVERDESHLQSRVVGWRVGPLRAIRAQEQWVFLGWGLRTPIMRAYAVFYPDHVEVPVAFRLRFPATYFFSDIRIRAYADFRDLHGWVLLLPEDPAEYPIDGTMSAEERGLRERNPEWFALRGATVTLVQVLTLSDSLRSVKRTFFFNDSLGAQSPPESSAGELPGVGYELSDWQHVGAGLHTLQLVSFVVPNTVRPEDVVAAYRRPATVQVLPLPSAVQSPRL
ncbi:MAG: hypothetical protein N3C12_12195 [Candidatus Binatia bacterium]|nr:hypothetical protein [Candidatus Binatia bacterium]